ncbi:MAG: UDPGP type 1 family protein [Planctomycetaceae bacterium]|jgi:UDP-N-acetylglucosamine/UDP-N-acetylgalactosamine diphosphorylase|nr:UDPGP type 1 family protein [Planctomycetaceae bacterium]
MKNSLLSVLKPFGQEHLLTFWDNLSATERTHLAAQIHSIVQNTGFAEIAELYEKRGETAEYESLVSRANDPEAYKFSTVTDPTPVKSPKALTPPDAVLLGQEALRNRKVAAALVAGGQGTRLGFPHPKGMYPIGPASGATLFQIHCEKILAAQQQYGHTIPYCIMTSPATHQETVQFLHDNRYFGLQEKAVFLFCQGTMPAVSMTTGKVLLDTPSSIALSPDGHGGMLAAITRKTAENAESSILDTLEQRGIEYLFYHQVDNPLVQILSPEFLGYHIGSGSELTSQVVRKRFPTEKVGNIVEIGGRLRIIEYSDLPESAAKLTNPDGTLKIWAGSIAAHVFNTALLRRESKNKASLPFHLAEKKVPYIDLQSGERIKPEQENAVKFERFIFDLLPSATNAVVVEVDPPHHYAPLKNAPGSASDCPETVKQNIAALYPNW